MKAQITELWDTGREIITTVGSDTDHISCLADLAQYENCIYDRKAKQVLIDDVCCAVAFRKVLHPSGGGSLYVVEVDYYI